MARIDRGDVAIRIGRERESFSSATRSLRGKATVDPPQRTRAFGAASSLADGGTWWSLAYSDRLFGGTGPVLDPLFSPLPGSPSISIAFPNPPSNADYTVRGYVLSATSLAQVQLRGGTNWRSDPTDPPSLTLQTVDSTTARSVGRATQIAASLEGLTGPLPCSVAEASDWRLFHPSPLGCRPPAVAL